LTRWVQRQSRRLVKIQFDIENNQDDIFFKKLLR